MRSNDQLQHVMHQTIWVMLYITDRVIPADSMKPKDVVMRSGDVKIQDKRWKTVSKQFSSWLAGIRGIQEARCVPQKVEGEKNLPEVCLYKSLAMQKDQTGKTSKNGQKMGYEVMNITHGMYTGSNMLWVLINMFMDFSFGFLLHINQTWTEGGMEGFDFSLGR